MGDHHGGPPYRPEGMERIPEWVERRRRKKAERLRREHAARIAHGRRLAAEQDLGQLGDIFRLHHTAWWWGPTAFILMLPLFLGVPVYVASIWAKDLTPLEWRIIAPSLLVGGWVILIFLAVRTGTDRHPGHNEWIYSCDAGFVHVHDRTRAMRVTRWDQVVAVYRHWVKVEPEEGNPYFLPAGHVLVLDGGANLSLTRDYRSVLFEPWFPLPGLLGDVLERAVTDRLLHQAMAAYEQGEVVWFGPVGVGRQGVTVGPAQETLAWTEFGGLAQVSHALVLWRQPGSQPLRRSVLKEMLHNADMYAADVYMGHLDAAMERKSAGRQRARPSDTWQILEVDSIPNLCVLEAMLAQIEAAPGS